MFASGDRLDSARMQCGGSGDMTRRWPYMLVTGASLWGPVAETIRRPRWIAEHDDISLGNPFGPFVKGRQKVVETVANAAIRYRDGEVVGFDLINKHVTPDLALLVEVERFRAKVGGSSESVAIAVRTTQVFRPEGETWKMVHRHTDPITTPQSSESIIPK
jgi:ketosteroid isomerase-like protein